jgi:hypothetical protein
VKRAKRGAMSDLERGEGSFRVKATVCPFENLVGLHVRWPGNRLGTKFPLKLLLEIEAHDLKVRVKPGKLQRLRRSLSGRENPDEQTLRLRVRLRYCYVRFNSNEIYLVPDSKYQWAITEGEFETNLAAKSRAVAKSHLGARAGAQATLNSLSVAKLAVHASAGFSGERDRTIETTTKAKPAIYEVMAVPNGWRIGDPEYGDPSKASQCLDGRYFEDHPNFPQTCEAEFLEGNARGILTFTVTVRDGVHVQRIDGGTASSDEKNEAEMAMRDRIAAIRLEHYLGKANGNKCKGDDEIPIAAAICEVVRAADEDTKEDVVLLPLQKNVDVLGPRPHRPRAKRKIL